MSKRDRAISVFGLFASAFLSGKAPEGHVDIACVVIGSVCAAALVFIEGGNNV